MAIIKLHYILTYSKSNKSNGLINQTKVAVTKTAREKI